MSRQVIAPVQRGHDYTPEQESAVRTLYETLGRTKKPDHRIFAAALAEAFMSGMETQEQIHADAQYSVQTQTVRPSP
ncbi:MAG: hypothetical protein IJT94_00965 [Oscillibacter sp.]|nr:hypothetical protein [Oscillibacter sp.]